MQSLDVSLNSPNEEYKTGETTFQANNFLSCPPQGKVIDEIKIMSNY